jgi:hypothetical protein
VRVDLDDLPPTLREAVGGLDLLAAWRESTAAVAASELHVVVSPPAERLATLVRERETTTLLTPDGTLLVRDRFTLAQVGDALRLTLPEGAKLWSASVAGQPVVPLQQAGSLVVPLTLLAGEGTVEVVSVREQPLPAARARLELAAPQVQAPVLEHRWRLLLPASARYRFVEGDLRPAPTPAVTYDFDRFEEKTATARDPWKLLQNQPAAVSDSVNVGGRADDQQAARAAKPGLQVHVVDERGQAVPGVTLTVTPAQGVGGAAVSDAKGVVLMPLAPGFYTLRAELEGFSTVEWPNLRIADAGSTSIEVTLSASVEDAITVTAEAPLLDERRLGNTTTLTNDASRGGYFSSSHGDREMETKREADRATALFRQQAGDLKNGLVGGVRPLTVEIPESGKAILLAGVLPPDLVRVALDVKPETKKRHW